MPFPSPKEGEGVAVALSGGRDSVLLARLAKEHYGQTETPLLLFHIDHAKRSLESCREEQAFVNSLAKELELDIFESSLSCLQTDEASLREARYRALLDLSQKQRAPHILLGHHTMDQAETLLMRLCRGTDLRGLRGMPDFFEREGSFFYRPLLKLSCSSLEKLRDSVSQFFSDPTNEQTHYRRNHFRHRVLKEILEVEPHAIEKLQAFSESAVELFDFVEEERKKLESELESRVLHDPVGVVFLRAPLMRAPQPVLKNWIYHTLAKLGGGEKKLSKPQIQLLADFIKSSHTGPFSQPLPANIRVRTKKRTIRFEKWDR